MRSGARSRTSTGRRTTSSMRSGRIRHHHFGEGDYDGSERVIQQLLTEAGTAMSQDRTRVGATQRGSRPRPDLNDVQSPETYVGYERAEHFVSPGGAVRDRRHAYAAGTPGLNEWGLSGFWTIGDEHARLDEKDGGIVYRFHARDLHLVLGPARIGTAVRFRVTIDGEAPGQSHGSGCRRRGQGRRQRTAPVSTDPPDRCRQRPYVRDPIPRPRRPSLCVHFWLEV